MAFGSFTFDAASEGSVLIVPAVLVGRRDGRAWLTTVSPAGGGPPVPARRARPAARPAPARPTCGGVTAP